MQGLSDGEQKTVTMAMMVNFARGCVETMRILENNKSVSDWLLPYYLLATTFLELVAKIVIFKKLDKDGKTHREIEAELIKYRHDLSNIYSSNDLDALFLSKLDIQKVKKEESDGVYRYDFYLKNEKYPVCVYEAESIKYGLMTKKGNIAFVAYQTPHLLKLCENAFETMVHIS